MEENCWEHEDCGRQPGGNKVEEFGVCPAATDESRNGTNRGKNAGRCCWKVAGTLCGGQVQGSWAEKLMDCAKCDFYNLVKLEEGEAFQP